MNIGFLIIVCRILQVASVLTSELHIHLGGAYPLEFIEKIGHESHVQELNAFLDALDEIDAVDYHRAFDAFLLVGKIVDTLEEVENGVSALCEWFCRNEVSYAEVRTGLKDMGEGYESYLLSILSGIRKGCVDSMECPIKGPDVKLLLSLRRDATKQTVTETFRLLDKYAERGVVGLDISGDSTKGSGEYIKEMILDRRNQGLREVPVALHLGESENENLENQISELEIYRPKRIGHAVFLSPEASSWIREHRVPIEMCPTSSLKARMVVQVKDHPGIQFIQEGHPVVISTDDPLIFRTNMSQEYSLVQSALGYSAEQMDRLREAANLYRLDAEPLICCDFPGCRPCIDNNQQEL